MLNRFKLKRLESTTLCIREQIYATDASIYTWPIKSGNTANSNIHYKQYFVVLLQTNAKRFQVFKKDFIT